MKLKTRFYSFAILIGLLLLAATSTVFYFLLLKKEVISLNGYFLILLVQAIGLTIFAVAIFKKFDSLIEGLQQSDKANKQFTQNATHELQTPLTVIKANAELLLQSQNIREKEMEALGVILGSVNRLSKINTALILLSKIEHGRFKDLKPVSFSKIFEEEISRFKDLIQGKNLELKYDIDSDFKVTMSETLAGLLVANLLQNAIRHNLEESGSIHLEMDQNGFKLTNPGHPLKGDPETMFERFKRQSDLDESLGLGLPIIQRICEFYELKIRYINPGDLHIISISTL